MVCRDGCAGGSCGETHAPTVVPAAILVATPPAVANAYLPAATAPAVANPTLQDARVVGNALRAHCTAYMKREIRVMVCGRRFKGNGGGTPPPAAALMALMISCLNIKKMLRMHTQSP